MNMTLEQVNKLPELATSTLRELTWQIDWYTMAHAEAKASAETAWKLYYDAIDANEPKSQKDALYEVACMFDAIRKDAYHKLDSAKAQYLTMLN